MLPGLPDTYQGGELWNQRLVDPENRSRVDYDLRRRYLHDLTERERTRALVDGRIKMYTLRIAVKLRAQVVPRLTRELTRGHASFPMGAVSGNRRLNDLSPGHYRNAFTGEKIRAGESAMLADLLADFPLALLVEEP